MRKRIIRDPGTNEPYLIRWFLKKTNRWGLKLHRILRHDYGRSLHDHPWTFFVIVLWGSYDEELPGGRVRRVRWFNFKRATDRHRIIAVHGKVWTLFFNGAEVREWGFHTPSGWVDWRTYHDIHPIIFLDCDGVLNHNRMPRGAWRGPNPHDPACVERIRQVLTLTGAKVVLSSTWRLDDDWLAKLVACGIPEQAIIGRTPLRHMDRGEQIKKWREAHQHKGPYVVIDDDTCDIEPYGHPVVKTSMQDGGFKEGHVIETVLKLGGVYRG